MEKFCIRPSWSEFIRNERTEQTDLRREEGFVIQLILNPGHQVVDVLRSRTLDGFLDVGPVGPVILISDDLPDRVSFCVPFIIIIIYIYILYIY